MAYRNFNKVICPNLCPKSLPVQSNDLIANCLRFNQNQLKANEGQQFKHVELDPALSKNKQLSDVKTSFSLEDLRKQPRIERKRTASPSFKTNSSFGLKLSKSKSMLSKIEKKEDNFYKQQYRSYSTTDSGRYYNPMNYNLPYSVNPKAFVNSGQVKVDSEIEEVTNRIRDDLLFVDASMKEQIKWMNKQKKEDPRVKAIEAPKETGKFSKYSWQETNPNKRELYYDSLHNTYQAKYVQDALKSRQSGVSSGEYELMDPNIFKRKKMQSVGVYKFVNDAAKDDVKRSKKIITTPKGDSFESQIRTTYAEKQSNAFKHLQNKMWDAFTPAVPLNLRSPAKKPTVESNLSFAPRRLKKLM